MSEEFLQIALIILGVLLLIAILTVIFLLIKNNNSKDKANENPRFIDEKTLTNGKLQENDIIQTFAIYTNKDDNGPLKREQKFSNINTNIKNRTVNFNDENDEYDEFNNAEPYKVNGTELLFEDRKERFIDAKREKRLSIICSKGPCAFRGYDMINDVITIGRENNCDLMIDDPYVGKYHGIIFYKGESFFIADLGSKNGILLDDNIKVEGIVEIVKDTKVKIGLTELEIILKDNYE